MREKQEKLNTRVGYRDRARKTYAQKTREEENARRKAKKMVKYYARNRRKARKARRIEKQEHDKA